MQITLRQMQVFLAVARTENLSVAAQDLAMSKSAVSQALTELEGRLGVTLFERTRGRLLLSAEGRRLKPAADELMERTDDIESLFSGRTTGQLRLACTFTIGSFMLSDLMRDFQAHAGWMPEMRIANTAEVAESLLNFSTDISIVEGPVTNPHLITEPWISDEMVVVAPKGHRLTQGVATWEQLSRERWILREEGSSTRIFFDAQIGLHLSEHKSRDLHKAALLLHAQAEVPLLRPPGFPRLLPPLGRTTSRTRAQPQARGGTGGHGLHKSLPIQRRGCLVS